MSAPRRALVVGNWKMNLTETWGVRLLDELLEAARGWNGVESGVAPAFPVLRAAADRLASSAIRLGAQDVHWEDSGAFTGAVSPRMLAELGVELVIVGHSERRDLFGDTDERVRRKVAAVLRHGMTPILCVGEHEEERDQDRTLSVVERQLRIGLGDLPPGSETAEIVVAYEPVWAIGTGRTAKPEQVDEVHRMIREQLGSMLGAGRAAKVRILYGGSVKPENAAELFRLPEVDGALVGGASLEAAPFDAIVRAATGSA